MNAKLLDVSIESYHLSGDELRIAYTVASRHGDRLYLVHHDRLPIARLSNDQKQIEIWMGVPPQSELELSRFINLLQLPGTLVLQPGVTIKQNINIELPLKQGGYWTEESENSLIPVKEGSNSRFIVVQGYGVSELNHKSVRSIKNLYEWQMIAQSQAISMILPPQ